jgi:DNA-binding NarL/FixJ family response regulator
MVDEHSPDVLVASGSLLRNMNQKPAVRVVAVIDQDQGAPSEAHGIVMRQNGAPSLVEAVRAAAIGKKWRPSGWAARLQRSNGLSPREADIVQHVSNGCSNRDIAQRLGLSEQSVKNLVSRILKKKGYTNRVQIALEAWSGRS